MEMRYTARCRGRKATPVGMKQETQARRVYTEVPTAEPYPEGFLEQGEPRLLQ